MGRTKAEIVPSRQHRSDAIFIIEIETMFTKVEILKRTTLKIEKLATKIYFEEFSKFRVCFDRDDITKQLIITRFFPAYDQIKIASCNKGIELKSQTTHSTAEIVLKDERISTSDGKLFLLFDT